MGKVLIIKSADFSENALAQVSFSDWEEVNLDSFTLRNYMIASTNKWTTPGRCVTIPVTPGQQYRITANSTKAAHYAPLTTDSISSGTTPSWASGVSGRIVLAAGTTATVTMPSDAQYLYILFGTSDDSNKPSLVEVYNP